MRLNTFSSLVVSQILHVLHKEQIYTMKKPLILLSLLALPFCWGYGTQVEPTPCLTCRDTIIDTVINAYFNTPSGLKEEEIHVKVKGGIRPYKAPDIPRDSIVMWNLRASLREQQQGSRFDTISLANYRWGFRLSNLPDWVRRSMTPDSLVRFLRKFPPHADSLAISPNEDKLRTKGCLRTIQYDSDSAEVTNWHYMRCPLGSYRIGHGEVFDISVEAYWKIHDDGRFACDEMSIGVENYDTTAVDIQIIDPEISFDGAIRRPPYRNKDVAQATFTVKGFIRMARLPTEGDVADTTVYRYDYIIHDNEPKGNITRCDTD